MEDLILNLGEMKSYSGEDFVGIYLIEPVRLLEAGTYNINGNVTNISGVEYSLDFIGNINDVPSDKVLFGFSNFITIAEPTEIYLKFDKEMTIKGFNVNVIRTG